MEQSENVSEEAYELKMMRTFTPKITSKYKCYSRQSTEIVKGKKLIEEEMSPQQLSSEELDEP